ncbi:MAG: hypothetical protein LQ351_007566 [Letrouitia transgressa]|nr:MAG: hypothetical protein LQ351_007566 [Letrouitia transgressa]
MDPVSRNLASKDMQPQAGDEAVADLKTQLGDMQIGGGGDILVDDYDPVDEKPNVAIITPDGSADEPLEPLADDYDAIRERYLPLLPDLETEYEAENTWHIENYRSLTRKERGPKFDCGGHPWRILLFPFGNNVDFASFYLEQGHDDDDKPPEDWYACVQFTLVLWNRNDPSLYITHTANHRFNAEESDWGFTRFAELRKLFATQWGGSGRPMVEDDAVNVTAYMRIYKDPTGVLWHNFINYNSKKETGMVGLKNQGATCYLNSLLQSLYFTNAFRKAVYQIPTENETERKNSAWALQRLFYLLQTNDDAVATQELTASFGWETKQIFEQQDVQELSRILMERMEERMKGTEAENALPKMFVGKTKTYLSCINVDYESSRIEDFWDIQLNVSGNRNLDDSFKDYIQMETLDGENKYFAEGYGLQDAKKGVIFESFPQVLHLQLKRFEFDINREATMKINDRYEFPEAFDAAPYLSESADRSEPWIYKLHGVLVHSGDVNAGHYYAFFKPTSTGHFYKFDDDKVTRATLKEALEENFGGDYANLPNGNIGAIGVRNPYTRTLSTKRSMSAYMLVYIRQSREESILVDVNEDDAPAHLARQLNEERAAQEKRRREKEEQHLYLPVGVVTEENFKSHQGFDLTNWDSDPDSPSSPQVFRVLRASTVGDFIKKVAETMQLPPDHIRLWAMVNRQNKTTRPDQPLPDLNMSMDEACAKFNSRDKPFRLWVEIANALEDGKPLWANMQPLPGISPPVLVFLKYFDTDAQTLKGVGHIFMRKNSKVSEMNPIIQHLMGWSPSEKSLSTSSAFSSSTNLVSASSLALYEEIKHSMIEPMKPKSTLQQAEIQDGDIVCFQKTLSEREASAIAQTGGYTDAREFYDYLLNRIIVKFLPKFATDRDEDSFTLALSRRMSYDQFSAKVGEHLKVDPTHLRFTTILASSGKPKAPVRRQQGLSLSQILLPQMSAYNNSQRPDALSYEILEMSISELETKKNLKVNWITEGITKEETFDVLVPKNGFIEDLISGLQKKANMQDEVARYVRIFEVHGSKIIRELGHDYSVASISEFTNLYAEVIPEEERTLGVNESVITAFQFDREPSKVHGLPFKFVARPGEPFKRTKERISRRIGIKGKQFDKIRFAVLQRSSFSKPTYLDDGVILLALFVGLRTDICTDDELTAMTRAMDDLLGLDHVNKSRTQGGKGDSIFIRA